jgi:hypothetical protein
MRQGFTVKKISLSKADQKIESRPKIGVFARAVGSALTSYTCRSRYSGIIANAFQDGEEAI